MNRENSWPLILGKLLDGNDLDRAEAAWAMGQIMSGDSDPAQIGAFMIALRAKGESVAELAGLVDTMLAHSVILTTGNDAVDIVGTGGDMTGTVNISSMASIVASAAGVPVMKHGSRSASGKTGSSEMLEVLGIRLDLSPERVAEVFREVGLTFFYAPVFHPAMRHVAPIPQGHRHSHHLQLSRPAGQPCPAGSNLAGRFERGDGAADGPGTGPAGQNCPGFQGF